MSGTLWTRTWTPPAVCCTTIFDNPNTRQVYSRKCVIASGGNKVIRGSAVLAVAFATTGANVSREKKSGGEHLSGGGSCREDGLRHFHWPRLGRVGVGTDWKLKFPRFPWASWCSQHLRLLFVGKWVDLLRERVLSEVRKRAPAPNYPGSILLFSAWIPPNRLFLTFWQNWWQRDNSWMPMR